MTNQPTTRDLAQQLLDEIEAYRVKHFPDNVTDDFLRYIAARARDITNQPQPDHCHELFEDGLSVQIKYFPDLERPYIASAWKAGTGHGPAPCGFGRTAVEALNDLTDAVYGLGEHAEEPDAG